MVVRVAINGYGRIGCNVLRALYEAERTDEIQIIAINDLGNAETNPHLTRFDAVHGRFLGEVKVEGDCLVVTATPDHPLAFLAKETGALAILAKPVKADELQRSIQRAVGQAN